ncbi:hypothetical protein PoB_001854900 [Plakobranchus ocellatus]|uniref:Uncharacterized protein n=1 Tax=Plakobranchus ocellatus TaxID=259542 RepID=A0AAV3ZCE3_9GAST|nr:hypothetical protein PoB_001854900 [Plakobranchus ocellatus]
MWASLEMRGLPKNKDSNQVTQSESKRTKLNGRLSEQTFEYKRQVAYKLLGCKLVDTVVALNRKCCCSLCMWSQYYKEQVIAQFYPVCERSYCLTMGLLLFSRFTVREVIPSWCRWQLTHMEHKIDQIRGFYHHLIIQDGAESTDFSRSSQTLY